MNTLKKHSKGYIDLGDILMGAVMLMMVGALGLLVIAVVIEESKPMKANTVAVQTVECDPVTVDSVPPYNCTLTISAEDQFMRDTFEANGYLMSLEYGQHRVGQPFPTHPEEEVAEGEAAESEGGSLTITVSTEGNSE